MRRRADEIDDSWGAPIAPRSAASPPAEDVLEASSAEEPDKESMVRALRDLEATKARVQRNAERVYDEERKRLVFELLPVLDNLDRTLKAAELTSDATLVKGLQMVRAQFEGVLFRYGVERIDAAGKRFDPAIHEAVSMIAVNEPQLHGMVIQQSEPGYRFGGRLLRAAKVNVGALTPRASPLLRRG